MKITLEDVRHIARLARLRLSGEEEKRLVEELDAILGYVAKLEELDVTDVPPTSHVLDVAAPLRADRVTNGPDVERLLENAPDRVAGFFRVPKIIEAP